MESFSRDTPVVAARLLLTKAALAVFARKPHFSPSVYTALYPKLPS